MSLRNQAPTSYGQSRNFAGLEKIAIRQRVKVAEKVIARLYAKQPNLKVLELGCGFYGANLRYLKTLFPEASFFGVDVRIDNDLCEDGLNLIEATLEDWRPTTKYDCILSLAVAEHLVAPQTHFELISLSLSNSGLAVITTPTPQAHVVLELLSRLRIFDKEACDDRKLYLTRFGLEVLAARCFLKVIEYRSISVGLNQSCILAKETMPAWIAGVT